MFKPSKINKITNNYQRSYIVPNRSKIHIPNGHETCQLFPFQGPPEFAQSGIFGMKINHLATLILTSVPGLDNSSKKDLSWSIRM
jgi:hypothetical protein